MTKEYIKDELMNCYEHINSMNNEEEGITAKKLRVLSERFGYKIDDDMIDRMIALGKMISFER